MGGYVPPHMRQGDGGGGGGRRRGAGGRSGSDNNRNRQPSAPATPDAAVQDAIKRKDAAERKLSKDGAQGAAHAASTLASIADELRSALASGDSLTPSARSDAGLALGEALCAAAAASITASRHGPLSPELARLETDARTSAAAMYEDAYVVLADLARWCETQIKSHQSQNPGDTRREWADATLAATTAAANALAARGDVSTLNTRDALARAVDTYESAAALSKAALDEAISSNDPTSSKNAAAEDLLAGLWNLADAKVKLAEASAEHAVEATVSSTVTSIEAMFQHAFQTYEEACQRCDSRAGDDLAGLLMDWGVAYASLAQILVDKVLVPSTNNRVPVTWDAAVAARAIASCDGALEKLGKSAEFGAGDVAAHVAFGEARRTKSEIYHAEAKVYQLCAREHDPAYGRAVAEADGALAAAADPAVPFGFGAALRLDSSNADALIGAAECHVERGRMHKQFGPDVLPSVMCEYDAHVSSMRSHFARGWELYARALDLAAGANPRKDPGWASDRLEVAYNAACAACLAGELDTARGLLESVVACGGATKEVIDADADLDALRG